GHRSYGAPMRPLHRPAGYRPHGPPMKPMRPNMNGARPNRTTFNKQGHNWKCSEDKKKQRNKKLEDSEVKHQFRGGLLGSKSI
nr:hypothetical protein [Tanacetum cinerariifolium]